MKKIMSLFLIVIVCFLLVGCSNNKNDNQNKNKENVNNQQNNNESDINEIKSKITCEVYNEAKTKLENTLVFYFNKDNRIIAISEEEINEYMDYSSQNDELGEEGRKYINQIIEEKKLKCENANYECEIKIEGTKVITKKYVDSIQKATEANLNEMYGVEKNYLEIIIKDSTNLVCK